MGTLGSLMALSSGPQDNDQSHTVTHSALSIQLWEHQGLERVTPSQDAHSGLRPSKCLLKSSREFVSIALIFIFFMRPLKLPHLDLKGGPKPAILTNTKSQPRYQTGFPGLRQNPFSARASVPEMPAFPRAALPAPAQLKARSSHCASGSPSPSSVSCLPLPRLRTPVMMMTGHQ